MQKMMVLLVAGGLTACASGGPPAPSVEQRKAPCDQLAARAIQSESLEVAKNLAAEASECYSLAQSAPVQ